MRITVGSLFDGIGICGNGDAWMEIKNAVKEAEELIRY